MSALLGSTQSIAGGTEPQQQLSVHEGGVTPVTRSCGGKSEGGASISARSTSTQSTSLARGADQADAINVVIQAAKKQRVESVRKIGPGVRATSPLVGGLSGEPSSSSSGSDSDTTDGMISMTTSFSSAPALGGSAKSVDGTLASTAASSATSSTASVERLRQTRLDEFPITAPLSARATTLAGASSTADGAQPSRLVRSTIDGWLKSSSGVNRVNAVAEGVLSNVDSESYPDRVLSIFNAYVADTEDFNIFMNFEGERWLQTSATYDTGAALPLVKPDLVAAAAAPPMPTSPPASIACVSGSPPPARGRALPSPTTSQAGSVVWRPRPEPGAHARATTPSTWASTSTGAIPVSPGTTAASVGAASLSPSPTAGASDSGVSASTSSSTDPRGEGVTTVARCADGRGEVDVGAALPEHLAQSARGTPRSSPQQ